MATGALKLTRALLLSSCLIALAAFYTAAQTPSIPSASPSQPDSSLQFDVATIKPNKSGSPGMITKNPGSNGFAVENMPLKMLISSAYDIRYDLISGGPDWIASDHYDVEGKTLDPAFDNSHPLTDKQRNLMIQALLADRFKLSVHFETKQLPMYNLVIARGGPHLQESKPDTHFGYGSNFGDIRSTAITTSTLASLLSQQLNITVTDQTGLTGKYDINLKWQSDRIPVLPGAPALPSLVTAVQEQLGLRLESTKGPVKTLVVDHAERPSEN
jgi:uncharacterized protein (TIGR03435 family)